MKSRFLSIVFSCFLEIFLFSRFHETLVSRFHVFLKSRFPVFFLKSWFHVFISATTHDIMFSGLLVFLITCHHLTSRPTSNSGQGRRLMNHIFKRCLLMDEPRFPECPKKPSKLGPNQGAYQPVEPQTSNGLRGIRPNSSRASTIEPLF